MRYRSQILSPLPKAGSLGLHAWEGRGKEGLGEEVLGAATGFWLGGACIQKCGLCGPVGPDVGWPLNSADAPWKLGCVGHPALSLA